MFLVMYTHVKQKCRLGVSNFSVSVTMVTCHQAPVASHMALNQVFFQEANILW